MLCSRPPVGAQAHSALTADTQPRDGSAPRTFLWFPETLEESTASAPTSAASLPPLGGVTDVAAVSTVTAIASFELVNGALVVVAPPKRVPGELLFRGALFYDAAGDVLTVLSTLQDEVVTATDDGTLFSVFGVYTRDLELVRALPPPVLLHRCLFCGLSFTWILHGCRPS